MRERLDKVLAHLGLGSRKEIARLARAGMIAIDGQIIRDVSHKFDPSASRIEIDGEHVIYQTYFHLLLNKPAGYVTSTKDHDGAPITELIPEEYYRDDWMPVGRLDKDTEGLLLLTTDGMLAHRLTHPRWKVAKRYYAELEEPASQEDINAFAAGMELQDEKLQPAELEICQDQRKVELVIREGRYHQVKRMFEARGNRVLYLKRVKFGPLELGSLGTGEAKELSAAEALALYTEVGLKADIPDELN